jgi:IS1 family transposase
VGVCREAALRLLVRVGGGCANLLDETMRDLPCTRLELDELWAFVGKKQRHLRVGDDPSLGDTRTSVAVCADTKIVPSLLTGKRTDETTRVFVADLAKRMKSCVQISTDALRSYRGAIGASFGQAVDYAQVTKTYEAEPIGPGRYSPPKVTGVDKTPIFGGGPVAELVSTSYVERNNLSIRMGTRRFTRLTNAHSTKLENHGAAVALWFAYYNMARVHNDAAGHTGHGCWSHVLCVERGRPIGRGAGAGGVTRFTVEREAARNAGTLPRSATAP